MHKEGGPRMHISTDDLGICYQHASSRLNPPVKLSRNLRYDLVLHMVTAAVWVRGRAMDRATFRAWIGV